MKPCLISVMVTMLVVLATACVPAQTPTAPPPTTAPTPPFTLATSIKDITGTWQNKSAEVYLRFYEDGTLNNADSAEKLDNQPYARSEIRFEGTQMSLKETAVVGVPSCGDALGRYEVRLLPDGKIQIVAIEDQCPPRATDTALLFEPVR
jgi:hypothetical protein